MMNPFIRWISDNRLFVAICAVFLATIAFFVVIDSRSTQTRASIDRQIEEEIAEESRGICEKWGMEPTTAAHIACVADLATVRTNHDNRRRIEDFGF